MAAVAVPCKQEVGQEHGVGQIYADGLREDDIYDEPYGTEAEQIGQGIRRAESAHDLVEGRNEEYEYEPRAGQEDGEQGRLAYGVERRVIVVGLPYPGRVCAHDAVDHGRQGRDHAEQGRIGGVDVLKMDEGYVLVFLEPVDAEEQKHGQDDAETEDIVVAEGVYELGDGVVGDHVSEQLLFFGPAHGLLVMGYLDVPCFRLCTVVNGAGSGSDDNLIIGMKGDRAGFGSIYFCFLREQGLKRQRVGGNQEIIVYGVMMVTDKIHRVALFGRQVPIVGRGRRGGAPRQDTC